MNEELSDYGLWWLVAINSLVFMVFAFSFFRPKSPRDWRSFGAFSAFLVALFTEMYGFPLTIYLASGWLTSRYPGVDWYAHDSGHLLEMMFGWGGDPHAGPFHLLSAVFVFGGFILLAAAWRVLYRAQRAQAVAMTGPYALVRHPQYLAFTSIMFGFLLQWPTLPTLVMFPILVYMYVRLARREERESLAGLGADYQGYMDHTPAFCPTFRNTLRLATALVIILALPIFISYLVVPERDTANAAVPNGSEADRVAAVTRLDKDLERARTQAGALNDQMRGLTGTTEPASRGELIRTHLETLRQIGETMYEMNRKMIEDVDNGKTVSATGLKQRLKLDSDVMDMQLEMLRTQTAARSAHKSDAVVIGTTAK